MALGTAATIFLGLGAAGAGMAASKTLAGQQKSSSPTPLPQPPSNDSAQSTAEKIISKRRSAVTQTNYTSPLGISGQAEVNRKTLLGQ